jgi:hypothetical protein
MMTGAVNTENILLHVYDRAIVDEPDWMSEI